MRNQRCIQDFLLRDANPIGGTGVLHGHFSTKICVKMKEFGPVKGCPSGSANGNYTPNLFQVRKIETLILEWE